jgi:hypothetical protein
VLLALAAGFGGLFALGSVIAAMFEVQGFTRPAAEPRPAYLLALAPAFAASVAGPALLARWWFGERWRPVASAGLVLGAVGALALLGLSLR